VNTFISEEKERLGQFLNKKDDKTIQDKKERLGEFFIKIDDTALNISRCGFVLNRVVDP
jgi:hypothetical protein